jgi:hypothetical protein
MPAPRFRVLIPALLLLSLLTSVMSAPHAEAGIAWCRVDPVVLIDGQLADVFVASTLAMHVKATGPVELVIRIPEGSTGVVILSDTGFGLKGYRINFVSDPTLTRTNLRSPVRVSAFAPSSDSTLPVEVTFAPRSLGFGLLPILFGMSAAGYSNSWVTVSS